MRTSRLEAFSDGVIAIIITIMVLEMKVPHEPKLGALVKLVPVFLSYVLSFAYVAIYWNNHHHLMHATSRVNGAVLWANMHLLFWLSLVPFTTGWMGENHFEALPTALYGVNLLFAAVSYWVLVRVIVRNEGQDSHLAKAMGRDLKGMVSVLMYLVAVPASFLEPVVARLIYLVIALLWVVPDKRIERALRGASEGR
ncbi:MAG: DUF1211 domain-containing protein [Flavobacteriales bacterium]|nr:DUF1211 domain-containing protein [Flavobacteriales bacterium]